jgi:hypothetical protein
MLGTGIYKSTLLKKRRALEMKYLFIASLWSAYCALHSYLISISFTNLMIRIFKDYYSFFRIFYVIFSFVLLVPLIQYTDRVDDAVIISYGPILTLAREIFISGSLLLFFWAFFFNYDSLSFFGIRQILNFRKEKDKIHPGKSGKTDCLV